MVIGRNTVSGRQLSGFIERIEKIRTEKKALGDDERAIFAEAKAAGFSPATMRRAAVAASSLGGGASWCHSSSIGPRKALTTRTPPSASSARRQCESESAAACEAE